MLAAVNAERQRNGLAPLVINAQLMSVAQKHSDFQQQTQKMSHTGQGGSQVWDRVKAEGFNYRMVGENVAAGQADIASVMSSWMNSEGHRKNILTGEFTALGWGKSGAYWTQVLAA